MVRFGDVILTYFVIGAVMFGGGAVTWDDSGVTQFFITVNDSGSGPAEVEPTNQSGGVLSEVGGTIEQVASLFTGVLILVWKLVIGLIAYLHWPLVVCIENNVPLRLTVILGGPPTVAFYVSVIRLIRTSA